MKNGSWKHRYLNYIVKIIVVAGRIPSEFGEKVDFIDVAILSISDQLGFSARLNFIILKPCSLTLLHLTFENS